MIFTAVGFGLSRCVSPLARFFSRSEPMNAGLTTFTLYALRNPSIPEAIRYIGITSQPLKERLGGHCIEKRFDNPYKCRWIMQLKRQGLKPELVPLIVGLTQAEALELEVHMIREFRQAGHRLTNISLGGEAFTLRRKLPRRVRAKISASLKRRFSSEEVRQRQSDALKRAWESPELRAKQSVKQKAHWSPETRAAASVRTKKRFESPEARAKLSVDSKARWPANRASFSGRKHSPESKAKISAARTKYFQSPEARARQSEDVKKHWVKRRMVQQRQERKEDSNGETKDRKDGPAI